MTQVADLRRVSIMLGGTIEYLIDILDYIHGDPDFEPEEPEDVDSDQDVVRLPRMVWRRT